MFIALVMACLANNPDYCKILEDQQGPYETRKECKMRALEISRDIHRYWPLYKPVRFKCKSVSNSALTAQW